MTDAELRTILKSIPNAVSAVEQGRDGDIDALLRDHANWPKERKPVILGWRGLMHTDWLGVTGSAVLRATINAGMSDANPVVAAMHQLYNHALSSDEGVNVNVPEAVAIVSSLTIDPTTKANVLAKLVETPVDVDRAQLNRILSGWRPNGQPQTIPE